MAEDRLAQLVATIDDRLKDLATSQRMAVDLIQETLQRLEYCQARLAALNADLARARHHEVDAVSALQLYRDALEKIKDQSERDKELAQRQREEIKALEKRVFDLERRYE